MTKNVATQKFGNVFHFIDDLTAIKDGGEFTKVLHERSYPAEIQLKNENRSTFKTAFLDPHIKILNEKFTLGLRFL